MSSPNVSVIIPTYNSPQGIELTLESVTGQTYSEDNYEIIAVDNNSTDNTPKVIQRYASRYDNVHYYLEDSYQCPAAARNKGIEGSSGSILMFIDADMAVKPDWIELVVRSFETGSHDYMGCDVEVYATSDPDTIGDKFDKLFAFSMDDYFEKKHYVGTGCLSVRREVFNTVGLFDRRLSSGEDKEFGQRVHAAGFEQHYEPSIKMYHPTRSSIVSQLKKSYRLGKGQRQLQEIHPDRFDFTEHFRPQDYLPLHPMSYMAEFGQSAPISTTEHIEMYLLISGKKIANSFGSLNYISEP